MTFTAIGIGVGIPITRLEIPIDSCYADQLTSFVINQSVAYDLNTGLHRTVLSHKSP
jgi:hypothetical protein